MGKSNNNDLKNKFLSHLERADKSLQSPLDALKTPPNSSALPPETLLAVSDLSQVFQISAASLESDSSKPVQQSVMTFLEEKRDNHTLTLIEKTLLDHLTLGPEHLTREDIVLYNQLEANLINNGLSQGHAPPDAIDFGILGEVQSTPRDLNFQRAYLPVIEEPLSETSSTEPSNPVEPSLPPLPTLTPLTFKTDLIVHEGLQATVTGETEPLGTLGQYTILAQDLLTGGTSTSGPSTLSLSVVNGSLSGYIDTQTGQPIELIQRGNTIEGHVVGEPIDTLAFTLTLDTQGITLTQIRAIVHPEAGEEISLGMTPNVLTLIATVNEAGISTSIDLGPHIRFVDDTPHISLMKNEVLSLNLDESPGLQNTDVLGTSLVNEGLTVADIFKNLTNTGTFPNLEVGYARSGSALVTPLGNAGSDGESARLYSLAVTQGANSGVSFEGTQIFLYALSPTLIVGRLGNEEGALDNANPNGVIAFALATHPQTGEVYSAQYLPLQHFDVNNPNESLSLNPFAIEMQLTVTDKDGDTAMASLPIGSQILFTDDGPEIHLTLGDESQVLLTTLDANTQGNDSDVALSTAHFSDVFNFTSIYGADGPGSFTLEYELTLLVPQGTPSGLTRGGEIIYLYALNGTIIGSTSSNLNADSQTVFSISVNNQGQVSLSQMQALDHPPSTPQMAILANGLVNLSATATVIDADGDKKTLTQGVDLGGNIRFLDDGPSVTLLTNAQVNLTLDETPFIQTDLANEVSGSTFITGTNGQTVASLFNGLTFESPMGYARSGEALVNALLTPGADDQANHFYGLSVQNGQFSGVLTTDGAQIFLYQVSSSLVVGRVGIEAGNVDLPNPNGPFAFALSTHPSTGEVFSAQYLSLNHPITLDSNDTITLDNTAVQMTLTLIDKDGDTAMGQVNIGSQIGFNDDGPHISLTVSDDSGLVFITKDANTLGENTDSATLNFASLFTSTMDYGADGVGSFGMHYGLDITSGAASGLTHQGLAIYLYTINGIVTASIATSLNEVSLLNTIFSITVNNEGQVTLFQMQSIDHPPQNASTAPFEDQSVTLMKGLVTLSASAVITDKDGDTAVDTKTLDLGGHIQFKDDGPRVSLSKNTASQVIQDETLGLQDNTNEVAGDDFIEGASGFTVASLFRELSPTGMDLEADSTPIGYARSKESLAIAQINAGGDLEATRAYTLEVINGTYAGIATTEGVQIFLYQASPTLVIGRVGHEGAGNDTPNALGVIAFAMAIHPLTGEVFTVQYLSFNHPVNTSSDEPIHLINDTVQMTLTVTDQDGDKASAKVNVGAQIGFKDDGPSLSLTANPLIHLIHDETVGVQSSDVLGTALVSGSTTVASLFNGLKGGTDTDTSSSPLGYARSNTSLVSASVNAGSDGELSRTYSLSVVNGTYSGILTTEGTQIFLYQVSPTLVIGRVGIENGATDTAYNQGDIAFAIATNAATGEGFIAQYLSINHPLMSNTVTLSDAVLQMTLSVTDKDGDRISKAVNVGAQIGFEDDTPTISIASNPNTKVVHDETLGLQTNGSNDVSGATVITGNISIASLFSGVTSNPDTPIGYARSSSAFVNPNTLNPGVDGQASQTYNLSVNEGANSGVLTTQGTQIFLYQISSSLIVGRVGDESGMNDMANSTGDIAFAIAVHPITGEVFIAQYLSLNHPLSSNPNEAISLTNSALQMTMSITDKDGDVSSSNAINIGSQILFNDDAPVANNINKTGEPEGTGNNVTLILDISGSMDDNNNEGINALKIASLELLDQYASFGTTMVRIVSFSTTATNLGNIWMTVGQAKAAIMALTTGGNTNFDDALAHVIGSNANYSDGAFNSLGALSNAQNISYFISDGNPNEKTITSPGVANSPFGYNAGIDTKETAAWEAFLRDSNGSDIGGSPIRSYALGMGASINASNLNPIAYDGYNQTNTNALIVTDLNDLSNVLTDTVRANPIVGSLITDTLTGSFGSDGGHVNSITVNGVTYTFNAIAGSIVVSGSPTSGTNSFTFDPVSHVLVVTLNTSGNNTGDKIAMNMDNGSYSYTAPSVISNASVNRSIGFVLIDNDGDKSGAVLNIQVDINPPPLFSSEGDVILTNQANGSNAITIPDWVLLANDTVGANTMISAVNSPISGSVSHTFTSVTFIDDTGSNGGSFVYTSTTQGKSDTANVLIDRSQAGQTSLDGANTSEILLGSSGNDILNGNGGNDILLGGAGNDILNGGAGNDILDGGAGNNTITYATSTGGITVSLSINTAQATLGSGNDTFIFSGGANTIQNIIGSNFADNLTGDAQNNSMTGGAGQDTLTGGAGADTFIFNAITDSGTSLATADIITDFTPSVDKINLQNIDANLSLSGDQAFTFNNTTATALGVWVSYDTTHTFINIDNNNNTIADMTITLNGILTITASDFVL